MKYNTPSLVIVNMRDLDAANALCTFLTRALKIGDMGGDLELAVVNGKQVPYRKGIGHDVRFNGVFHVIDQESARQEKEEAPGNTARNVLDNLDLLIPSLTKEGFRWSNSQRKCYETIISELEALSACPSGQTTAKVCHAD